MTQCLGLSRGVCVCARARVCKIVSETYCYMEQQLLNWTLVLEVGQHWILWYICGTDELGNGRENKGQRGRRGLGCEAVES